MDRISLFYLQARGYINIDINTVSLTNIGKVFIAEGGFRNEHIKRLIDGFKFTGTILITLIATLISFLAYKDAKDERMESDLKIQINELNIIRLEKKIDSLDKLNTIKRIKPSEVKAKK